MRLIALGDTHLGFMFGRTPEARDQMKNDVTQRFEFAIQKAKSLRADVILHLGDFFDKRNVKGKILEDYFSIVETALQSAAYISISGNHDTLQPESLFEFIQPDYHPIRSLTRLNLGEVELVGFSYVKKPRLYYSKAEKLVQNASLPVIGIFHQIFYGTWFGPQHFTFRFPDTIRTRANSPITINLSGHIHRAQILQRNVIYPGSVVRTSFVESIEPKGYVVIDVEDKHIEAQFHELPTYPMIVHEIDLTSERFEDLSIDPKVHSLIRAYGKPLSHIERSRVNEIFPAEEYPFISISPRNSNTVLKPLYSTYSTKFIPPYFSTSV